MPLSINPQDSGDPIEISEDEALMSSICLFSYLDDALNRLEVYLKIFTVVMSCTVPLYSWQLWEPSLFQTKKYHSVVTQPAGLRWLGHERPWWCCYEWTSSVSNLQASKSFPMSVISRLDLWINDAHMINNLICPSLRTQWNLSQQLRVTNCGLHMGRSDG